MAALPDRVSGFVLIAASAENKIKTCSLRERPEIMIACEEGHTTVDAALGNQASPRRALRRFTSTIARNIPALCQKPDSISISGISESVLATSGGKLRVAQQLREHNWRHRDLPDLQSLFLSNCASSPFAALQVDISKCWYRRRSSVRFQFRHCFAKNEPCLGAGVSRA